MAAYRYGRVVAQSSEAHEVTTSSMWIEIEAVSMAMEWLAPYDVVNSFPGILAFRLVKLVLSSI